MPRIRIGVIGKANARGKLAIPKVKRAKISNTHVGSGNTGKETQHTVQRRMADPNRPITTAGQPPRQPTTLSKHIAAGGSPKSFSVLTKHISNPNTQSYKVDAAHHQMLKNDPFHHYLTAQVMNSERSTRKRERTRYPKKPKASKGY